MAYEVTVSDRSHPLHKMLTPEKRSSLLNALFEMLYRDLMSDVEMSPKYSGSYWKDGTFKLRAVDEHSAEVVVDIVERMPPPWPNAEIYVTYSKKGNVYASAPQTYVPPVQNNVVEQPKAPPIQRTIVNVPLEPEVQRNVVARPYVPEVQRSGVVDRPSMPPIQRSVVELTGIPGIKKNITVEAYVQGEVISVDEFLQTIKRFDNRFRIGQWQPTFCRPHGQGHVYTFNITQTDFQVLNDYDGFIPFYGNQVEFRVLNNS
ncbi:uncharacterized protein LOC129916435 [Episyrphus balteatus]|uniref:uncharacterized protein LOC129916435 n=1 Tax=Episyrphus balteatus TaxID=286459 RepID=UPI0024856DCA|nr:uncharacterized protein LOC129916435 [Episyrphus balteatus]